jgi:putative acyl-CoA dehydrogenase
MTERTGGSDVSQTETIAERDPAYPNDSDHYLLTGYKFFTSATTSQVAFALARVGGVPGSRGLSLFLIKIRNENGKLNNIIIHRLKDKLGTKQVPTAELELKKTPALLLGSVTEGVKTISLLFNVTRIHAAIAGVSSMRFI